MIFIEDSVYVLRLKSFEKTDLSNGDDSVKNLNFITVSIKTEFLCCYYFMIESFKVKAGNHDATGNEKAPSSCSRIR
jgi:hypothetical protein